MDNLSREWLDYQADQLESLLASHKLDVAVIGVQISPRWVRYLLDLGLGTRITNIEKLNEEIALTLGANTIRVTRTNGNLAIEAPLDNPEPIYLLSQLHEIDVLPPVTAVLGLTADGDLFTLPFMAPEVTHVLISGATGSGKTELLRSILLSMAVHNQPSGVQMALIDPKRRGFGPLEDLPHLFAPIATTPESAIALLEKLIKEMERRDQEDAPAIPRIIVAVDEVSDLITTGGKEVETLMVRLAQRGRESGFHLLCSTQRPAASAVPSALKANLPARLIGKVASAQESLTAAGISGVGAEELVGNGDFVSVIGGRVTRFQSAYTGPIDIMNIIAYLNETPIYTPDTFEDALDINMVYDEYDRE